MAFTISALLWYSMGDNSDQKCVSSAGEGTHWQKETVKIWISTSRKLASPVVN